MLNFTGTGVALVTPFKNDLSVDYDALERHVNFQIANGINYLVVLGTTGEPATLTRDEKEKVKACIIKTNNGRLPLVIGIGGNNTTAVIEEIQSSDLSNFDAILSVSPYYNKPTQEGIYQHFKAIANATPKPIILYNVPGRTSMNIDPTTVLRLASDFPNIIGIKEAAGNMDQAFRLMQSKPDDFLVISGDDMLAMPITLTGGSGVISVIGQGLPKEFSSMIQYALDGNAKSAFDLHYQMMNGIDYIFEEGNPAGVKSMLSDLRICGNQVRLPLVKASNTLGEKISNFMTQF